MITKETPLKKVLEIGKECDKCNHCCSFGSGYLVGKDKKRVAEYLGIGENELVEKYLEEQEKFNTSLYRPKIRKSKNKPYGECIFLDKDKGCTIHEVKPLHCRIGNCKKYGEELSIWFTLNYFVNPDDPESIRQWNTYMRSGGKTLPGGRPEDLVKDKEQLKKILDYEKIK